MINILNVVGARPNFIKMAPILAAINRHPGKIAQVLVHTGQHYDEAMSASFFRDLAMPPPDINLEIGSGTHAEQTANVMLAIEPILIAQKPDWVLVVGDVNSTLACALTAAKLNIKIAHVEAGLRSFDRTMPEEINRILTDRIADLLLTPSADADANLLREGIAQERIVRVGNVMIDTLFVRLEQARRSKILTDLNLSPQKFAVLTLHRPSNVDDSAVLVNILTAIKTIAAELPVIFPAHPRTWSQLLKIDLTSLPRIQIIEPLGYLDFLQLWSNARMVLTDSGGLQEETTALGIPCLTLRENTERPITVEQGSNRIVGTEPERILANAFEVLHNGQNHPVRIPELWDGHAAERIVEALLTS